MENTNKNQLPQNTGEFKKIEFVPDYSTMFLYDADLSKVIIENLNMRFPRLVNAVSIRTVKDPATAIQKRQCPIEIYAYFVLSPQIFKANINPRIAKLVGAEEEYNLRQESIDALKGVFLSEKDILNGLHVKEIRANKNKYSLIELKLNPYLTLSSLLDIPTGNVFDIPEVKSYSKNNVMLALRTYKKKEIKKKNKNPR